MICILCDNALIPVFLDFCLIKVVAMPAIEPVWVVYGKSPSATIKVKSSAFGRNAVAKITIKERRMRFIMNGLKCKYSTFSHSRSVNGCFYCRFVTPRERTLRVASGRAR